MASLSNILRTIVSAIPLQVEDKANLNAEIDEIEKAEKAYEKSLTAKPKTPAKPKAPGK